jgi:superfamily II DNA/RNA helicase
MMPLALIEQVTQEYVMGLLSRFKVVVHFDGNGRRRIHSSQPTTAPRDCNSEPMSHSKQETTQIRKTAILDTWQNLLFYVKTGGFPTSKTICSWRRDFPRPRLLIEQIQQTLQSMMGVTLQLCEEESDAVIARAAMGISNAYILGSDSDFCFFPNVNYIPFSTLDVNGRSATAVVIRRSDLASSLGLEDSQMVELAILCGNDYLVDPTTANLDFEYPSRVRIKEIVDRLRALPQYQVSTSDPHVEEILHFVRVHYNLGDIEQFPLIDVEDEEEEERVPSADLNASYEVSMARPRVPLEVDLALAVVTPGRDVSVKDAVLRCLEAYVETAQDHAVVSRNHLEVFRALQVESQVDKSLALVKSQILPHRQDWADNVALYVIARVIAYSLKNSKSRLVQFTSPFKLFDFYQFHCMVQTSRGDMHGDVDSADLLSETKHPTVDEDDGESDLAPTAPLILPIDEHEQTILQRIRSNRVSIIQAETGAGKSSRVPVMILKAPPPDPLVPLNLFISQPRRIAAKALVERLRAVEPELKDCFALRMGHGVREYESGKTRATFVTAGYLVRLLANYPGRFDKVSHLIIDEVHERSVETDLLCLLCRRLLHENGRIRLVLMSATLASTLYQTYFDVPQPPLKVGARRFPVTEIFLDDFDSAFSLPPKIKRNITSLIAEGKRMKCKETPPLKYMEDLYPVVAHIAMIVGRPGTSVLVFVPGMNEIVAVTEEIEKLCVDGVRYNCLPIHSDIPFEDQLDAFKKPAPDEVIVIIATNAAESSVTLPAVDCVVCTGLCKQIIYSETSHRQMLMPAWISKASATQRAGRTGRLRPGTVL